MEIHSHCSYCGAMYPAGAGWPRRCPACGNVSFRNPAPVVIVLQPIVETSARAGGVGVLTVRRAIEPHKGALALPGGYVDYGEGWQAAGARELLEEAGVDIEPERLRPVEVYSAADHTLIIAAIAPVLEEANLPPFHANVESSERVVLTRPEPLAFELHTTLVSRYLGGETLGYAAVRPGLRTEA